MSRLLRIWNWIVATLHTSRIPYRSREKHRPGHLRTDFWSRFPEHWRFVIVCSVTAITVAGMHIVGMWLGHALELRVDAPWSGELILALTATLVGPMLRSLREKNTKRADQFKQQFRDGKERLKRRTESESALRDQVSLTLEFFRSFARQKSEEQAIHLLLRHLVPDARKNFAFLIGRQTSHPTLEQICGLSPASQQKARDFFDTVQSDQITTSSDGRAPDCIQTLVSDCLTPGDRQKAADVWAISVDGETILLTTRLVPGDSQNSETTTNRLALTRCLLAWALRDQKNSRQNANSADMEIDQQSSMVSSQSHGQTDLLSLDDLKADLAALSQIANADRVSVFLLAPGGKPLRMPALNQSRPLPPAVEREWQDLEHRIVRNNTGRNELSMLQSNDLRRLNVITLINQAILVPLQFDHEMKGFVCLTSSGRFASRADLFSQTGKHTQRLTRILRAVATIRREKTNRPIGSESHAQADHTSHHPSPVVDQQFAELSHELRTPMVGILGMTELALDTDLTNEQREYIEAVRYSSNSLLEMIGQVLDASKLTNGKLQLNPQPASLREMVKQTIRSLQFNVGDKDVKLTFHVDEAIPSCFLFDKGRLQQVLVNLVGNAIKFTRQGSVDVNVSGTHIKDRRWRMECEVSDSGIGMTPEQLDRIFEAYQQADETISTQFGGTGLGLSITRQILDLMQGTIEVISEIGRGTTFRICLELEECASRRKISPQNEAEAESPPCNIQQEHLFTNQILLADDDPIHRSFACRKLTLAGFNVVEAANGKELLERRRMGDFAAIVTDLQMPIVTGFEAASEIRKKTAGLGHSVLLVAMSAEVNRNVEEKCLRVGFDLVVPKPLSGDSVNLIIKECQSRIESSNWKKPVDSGKENTNDLTRRLLTMFMDMGPDILAEIEASLKSRQQKTLCAAAHKLKGSASCLGHDNIVARLDAIEQAGKLGDFDSAGEELQLLVNEFDQLKSNSSPAACTPAMDDLAISIPPI